MSAQERWHRVEELCQAALDRDARERDAFLDTACGLDTALLHEVKALLAHVGTSEQFLDQPFARAVSDRWGDSLASMTGRRFAHYVVGERLGAGGMGVVYRAEDTKLRRAVALKILSPDLARDEHAHRRLVREAQMLATFTHPHIGAIYGLEEIQGQTILVLELIEGQTLASRIERGPLPIQEALPIAAQIGEALEAAHGRDIIHCDLKPSNIALTHEGTVKVLDFGIARARHDALGVKVRAAGEATTLTTDLIGGTPSYMSPEQLNGHAADKRSDLWAYGCVLYEMLTGKRAFDGVRMSDAPDWSALPSATPAPVRRLLRRCLETDHDRRLADAADARLEIADALTPAADDTSLVRSRGRSRMSAALWATFGVVLLLTAIIAWWKIRAAETLPVYATIDVPSDYVLGEGTPLPMRTPMVFTPDGRALIIQAARNGRSQLFLRPLGRSESRPIAGTENARVPFVSPDGKWVGFWAANEIRKVPIEGGEPIPICVSEATELGVYGAAWGPGDLIVFGDYNSGRLMRVSANGGVPIAITPVPSPDRRHVLPFLLPDGRRVLFSDVAWTNATDRRLMVQALDGSELRLVLNAAADGRLLPSGDLVLMRDGTLFLAPFDVARARVTREPLVVLTRVMQRGLTGARGGKSAAGMFAVSSRGALAVVRGPVVGAEQTGNRLTSATASGVVSSAEPTSNSPQGARGAVRVSPDGTRAIVGINTGMRNESWIADWARDTWNECRDCDTFTLPVWSPDGGRLLVSRGDVLVAHTLDGSVPDRAIVRETTRLLYPYAWLATGRIVYLSAVDNARGELKVLEPGAADGRILVPLGVATDAAVSHDERWLAYTAREKLPRTVVVQAFPGPGSRAQVSAGAGVNPAWSPDDRTLYYLHPTGDGTGPTLVAVDVTAGNPLQLGKPRQLFAEPRVPSGWPLRSYDLTPDGRRFLFSGRTSTPQRSVTRFDLIQDWVATLPR
jgi:eukaryotic-like serine/threonine-protein kinase